MISNESTRYQIKVPLVSRAAFVSIGDSSLASLSPSEEWVSTMSKAIIDTILILAILKLLHEIVLKR